MKTSLSIVALSLSSALLAARAAEPATPSGATTEAAVARSDMICGREYATGSNIAVTKCRTTEQVEAEKAAADATNVDDVRGGSSARIRRSAKRWVEALRRADDGSA